MKLWYWLLRRFKRRDASARDLAALNELLVMAGRRVTYDLSHVLSDLSVYEKDKDRLIRYRDRIQNWHRVFNPGDVGKNYRASLHRDIADLEYEIERLRKLCEKHNIKHEDPNGIPF